jgi:hypothetical protein
LKNTLRRGKSGGDRILGGEGRDSPRNHQEQKGETQNHLESPLAAGWRSEEVIWTPHELVKLVKGLYTL